MLESKAKGTDSKQDRSNQPKRAGGNSAAMGIESHGSKRGERIAQGGSVGRVVETTSPRIEGGNEAAGSSTEKHDQAKAQGKKCVGGKAAGAAPVVDSNIQVSERRHGAGNDPDGAHENGCQPKATRLDMSVNRFDR